MAVDTDHGGGGGRRTAPEFRRAGPSADARALEHLRLPTDGSRPTALRAGHGPGPRRAVLLSGRLQLGIPRALSGGRAALQRLRLRPRHPLRAAHHGAGGRPGLARGREVRLPDDGSPRPPAPAADRRGGDLPGVRGAVLAGRARLRLGPRLPPPGLRRAERRAPGAGGARLARGAAHRLLPLPARPRLRAGAEEHGAHARPAVQRGVPPRLPEVQRPDLGVSLAAGGALRAARDGGDRVGAARRHRRGGGPLPRHDPAATFPSRCR